MRTATRVRGTDIRDSTLGAILFFCAIVLPIMAEMFASVIANGGVFGYTVDDGYIHLALAQRIQSGFYGINPGEFAAPSSSILWPFLLAVVPSTVPGWEFLPFLINFASTLAIAALFFRELRSEEYPRAIAAVCLGLALLISLNLSSLVMSGKEHGLQVALTVTGVWGLVELERTGRLPRLAVAALIVAPLVRYENFATTVGACVYLVLLRRWRVALNIILISVTCAAVFSAVLVAHGLSALPTSIVTRKLGAPTWSFLRHYSDVHAISAQSWAEAHSKAARASFMSRLISSVMINLKATQARTVLLLTLPLIWKLYRPLSPLDRRLAGYALFGVAAQMVGGFFDGWSGWCYGYEMYAVALELFVLVVLYRDAISRAIFKRQLSFGGTWLRPIGSVVLLGVLFSRYTTALLTIPLASSFHYSIETQAARFGSVYWKRPIGVEPLGTAFWNHNFILDYGGLASAEVANAMFAEKPDVLWMDKLAREHRIGLVTMGWVPAVPHQWLLMARLHWTPEIPIVFRNDMTIEFYATDPKYASDIREALDRFARTLPKKTKLEVCERPSAGDRCTPAGAGITIRPDGAPASS
jgi:hypothetical protein